MVLIAGRDLRYKGDSYKPKDIVPDDLFPEHMKRVLIANGGLVEAEYLQPSSVMLENVRPRKKRRTEEAKENE